MMTIEARDFEQEPIDLSSDAELEELDRLAFLRNNSIQSLESFLHRLETEGAINRSFATTIKTAGTGLEAMDKHFQAYPLASYTQLPSLTNHRATMEGLLAGVASALARAIEAAFKYVQAMIDKLNAIHRENHKRFDSITKSIPVMVEKLERRGIRGDHGVSKPVEKLIAELSPLAKWFIAPEMEHPFTRRFGAPSLFVKRLYTVELVVIDGVMRYIDGVEERSRDPERFHELKPLLNSKPESIGFYCEAMEVGRTHCFGEAVANRIASIRSEFKDGLHFRLDHLEPVEVIRECLRWAKAADFKSVQLQPADRYLQLNKKAELCRTSMVSIVRTGLLEPGQSRLGNDVVNDIRTMINGVVEFERLLTDYRTAVAQIGKLLYVYGKTS